MPFPAREEFERLVAAERGARPGVTLAVPVCARLLADHLTPVVAYRRLVAPDDRTAPSFLLESVEGGERQGRFSILSAQPRLEVVAREHDVRWVHADGSPAAPAAHTRDPFEALRGYSGARRLVRHAGLPGCFLGGWVGYAAYDSVRYAEPEKLPFSAAPPDDRGLPDLHFGFYPGVVVFDHVEKTVVVVEMAEVGAGDDPGGAYDAARARVGARVEALNRHTEPLRTGEMPPPPTFASRHVPAASNMSRADHARMVARALEYIRAGDAFQIVLGQRFEARTHADPFDVYRALRAVNPSPYMVYLQARGCILVASSPEILCRVRRGRAGAAGADGPLILTSRPLAGTRPRGKTPEEDAALERELLADPKERAEHVMLVDLGRNDVGKVARAGSIAIPALMTVERYSHVMHISSTVTGELREGADCWDALRATLPVGTISGAPKVRAMQIIDELEPVRRGPYGGGMGYVGLDGEMDIALALRTLVVPTAGNGPAGEAGRGWTYHAQAAGGIVADSDAGAEYAETVNKAAALIRAIQVAEAAF